MLGKNRPEHLLFIIKHATENLKELTDRIWSVSDAYWPYHEPDFRQFGLEKDVDHMERKRLPGHIGQVRNGYLFYIESEEEGGI